MGNRKITIISPKFHPQEDGLGQYTTNFYLHLKDTAQVSVITSTQNQLDQSQGEFRGVFSVVHHWKRSGLLPLHKQIVELNPDILLFQYVPFMYSKRGGINFSIVFYLLYLRLFTKYKLHIMYHELNYPLQANLKAILMFFCHNIMLFISGISAHKIFCSTKFFQNRIRKIFLNLKSNVFHLPVGSNIINNVTNIKKNELRATFTQGDEILVGCFGGFHPSKRYELILESIVKNNRDPHRASKIKLLFIGANKAEILGIVDEKYRQELDEIVSATGFLANDQVSLHLSILDCFVGYFVDGISTRRGSLIAALEQGIPVISTKTDKTNMLFINRPGITLLSAEPTLFQAQLENELLKIQPIDQIQSVQLKGFFERTFSWTSIIKQYLKNL